MLHRECLRVISVEYGRGKAAEMQQVFHMNLEGSCRALFICKDVVGVLLYIDDNSYISIVAINIVTNMSTTIRVDLGHPFVR